MRMIAAARATWAAYLPRRPSLSSGKSSFVVLEGTVSHMCGANLRLGLFVGVYEISRDAELSQGRLESLGGEVMMAVGQSRQLCPVTCASCWRSYDPRWCLLPLRRGHLAGDCRHTEPLLAPWRTKSVISSDEFISKGSNLP